MDDEDCIITTDDVSFLLFDDDLRSEDAFRFCDCFFRPARELLLLLSLLSPSSSSASTASSSLSPPRSSASARFAAAGFGFGLSKKSGNFREFDRDRPVPSAPVRDDARLPLPLLTKSLPNMSGMVVDDVAFASPAPAAPAASVVVVVVVVVVARVGPAGGVKNCDSASIREYALPKGREDALSANAEFTACAADLPADDFLLELAAGLAAAAAAAASAGAWFPGDEDDDASDCCDLWLLLFGASVILKGGGD